MDSPTGEIQQLVPDVEQVVGAEQQQPRQYDSAKQPVLPTLTEAEKRSTPGPSEPLIPVPADPIALEEEIARQTIFGVPILRMNRYTGHDKKFVDLLRWEVSYDRTGDLNEISVVSDDDSNTRYRIYIGGINQQIPEDRDLTSPFTARWDRTVLPPATEVALQVRTEDGTTDINVDAMIVGTER